MSLGTRAAIAALPIALILLMMLGLRWSAARAGGIGAAVAVLLARGVFGYGVTVHPELGPTRAVLGASAEAAFTAPRARSTRCAARSRPGRCSPGWSACWAAS